MRKLLKSRGGGVGEDVYDGAAAFGRFMALLSLIGGTLISLLLIGIGIYLLVSKDKYSGSTTANIKEANCQRIADSKSVRYECLLKLSYSVDGKAYEREYGTHSGFYAPNTTLNIRYDPSNPNDITVGMRKKTIAIIILCIGVFVLIMAWVWWWIVNTFKFAAAAQGVGSAYDIVT